MDSMEIEDKFPDFEIISEFTGLIHTIVAVDNGIRYWDYVGKNYADYLKQQKTAG